MTKQTNKYFWVQTSPYGRRPAKLLSVVKESQIQKQSYVTVRYLDTLEEIRYECVCVDRIEPMPPEEANYMRL